MKLCLAWLKTQVQILNCSFIPLTLLSNLSYYLYFINFIGLTNSYSKITNKYKLKQKI